LPNLGGIGGHGGTGAGLLEFQQVQEQLMQNPNLMREMVNMLYEQF
jgi:ubiquilin